MENKKCFVIMPFSRTTDRHTEQYWNKFFEVIKSEITSLGYDCSRSETGPYNLLKQVVEKINDSDLVVAVLTDLNPNVWYELGIRHSLKNGTIMLIEDTQKVPFDINSYGLIKYSDDISLATILRKQFVEYINKLDTSDYCDSPVADTIGIPSELKSKLDAMYELILKISNEKSSELSQNSFTQPTTYHRILWIDDYPSNNAQVIELFENKGVHFDIAISTSQGLKFLTDNRYDLIITDMGRGNEYDAGLKLITLIKERYPTCKTPIVVFASLGAINLYGDRALELGAIATINGFANVINLISKYMNL